MLRDRFIEVFVYHISLEALGFTVQIIKSLGRSSFGTKLFLKIYFYGYLNGHRSSIKILKQKTVLYTVKKKRLTCLLKFSFNTLR